MIDVITNNMDVWTSALMSKSTAGRGTNGKQTAYGIKKLRELILELAVRGKLVPQDANDEPASHLLRSIESKQLKVFSDSELSFKLPYGWIVTKFGDVFTLEYGANLPAEKRSNTGEYPVYGSNGIVGSHSECFVTSPCIVIGRKGSAGALNLSLTDGCCVTDVAYYCIPPNGFNLSYVFKLFHTLGLETLGKGIKPGLNRNEAYSLTISIPPLAEQHRIVAKVDELMALCDQLEQQQTDSHVAHQTLVEILLGTLTQATDATEFATTWQRIAQHFDTLFTTEHSIDQLKQTLLQLAVMGKLVAQDANDEPASVLLGKINKHSSPLEIPDIEIAFNLPINWKWVRLLDFAGEISTGPFGTMIHKQDYVEGGIPLINPSHMINSKIVEDPAIAVEKNKAEELFSYKLSSGDIVMARRGEMGRCALVTEREDGWLCGTGSFILKFHEDICRSYILILFRSYYVRTYLGGESVGATMTNLNHGILNKIPIPVPPVAEQHRIVAKVDELMALCDTLKARINQAQTTQIHLADALVEHAVA